MADKIVVMHDGIVEQVGAPLELYDRPANLFVAQFIGSPAMNVLPGRLEGGGFVTEGGLRLPVSGSSSGEEGKPALYGIRPEHFALSGEGVALEVVVVEPTGSETQVVAKVGAQQVICVFRERVQARPGETIRVTPNPEAVHLFDKDKGQRIN
jgi:multiple sugar transport system ATP-binding protein